MEYYDGFWLLALLLITFINWLSHTLKKRRDERRGITRDTETEEESELAGRVWKEPGFDQTAPLKDPESPSEPVIRKDPNDEIRDFFAALTGQAPPPQPQPVEQPRPTPRPKVQTVEVATIPEAKPAVRKPPKDDFYQKPAKRRQLTTDERRALAQYEKVAASKSADRKRARARHRNAIASLLHDPQSVRNAIILKEILDSPKALRPESGSGFF